jgi:hypothetical protein
MILRSLRLVVATLLLAACAATTSPPPPADPVFAALELGSIAVGPVTYATYQPGETCSTFIDEDLRSALVRETRRHGFPAFTVGRSVPRSFAPGSPPPRPGEPVPTGQTLPSDADALLLVWIDEYWENSLCGWEGPKYLTMGAVGVLYAGSPPREVWRHHARVAEQGDYRSQDLIWLSTSRLAELVLGSLPAGPGWAGQR